MRAGKKRAILNARSQEEGGVRMKILVLSDSHGNIENMMRAVEQEQPEMLIHLGDCWRDGQRLAKHYPNIPMTQVPGNCDFRSHEAMEKLLFIEKYRVLICHGHTYGVKQSLLPAGLAAEEQNADLFLFGHTHKPLVDHHGRALFLNPGTIGSYSRPTYGVVTAGLSGLDACTVLLK